jgi:hypothetical protein
MAVPRFIVARAAGDSVTLRDTERKRLAVVFLRDNSLPNDKAEAAAVRMAETCALALNQVHEAAQAKMQKEGGK